MKFKKTMLVTFLLLVILTLGAVSASEDADTLAAENETGDDLSVDETSPEVNVADETQDPEFDNIDIWVDDWGEFSTDNQDSHPLTVGNVPDDANGTIVVSSGEKVYIERKLSEFDSENVWDGGHRYAIGNTEFGFTEADSGNLIKVSFLNNGTQILSSLFTLNFVDNTHYRFEKGWDVGYWGEWDGPLYLDTTKSVISFNTRNTMINGNFYATANGQENKYMTHFDEWGNAYHNWALSTFNIAEPGLYRFALEYAPDDNSPRDVILRGVLNVTEFNYDAFRVIVDTHNYIRLYCPDNHEGIVSIFKTDWDNEATSTLLTTYEITPSDYNTWKSWSFEELGCQKDDETIFYMNIDNNNETIFHYGKESFWYNDPWDPTITPDIALDVWDGDFSKDDKDNDVFAVYIPEKANVFNGTLEIRDGDTIVYSKKITAKDMDFDDNSRDYRYWVKYSAVMKKLSALKTNTALTFAFKYNDTQIIEPFVMIKIINAKNYQINLERAYDTWCWNEWDGPLYCDYNLDVMNVNLRNTKITGITYVSANGFEYRYKGHFEDGEAWHSWRLSSFNITEPGSYPVTIKYATSATSEPYVVLKNVLNVVEFKNDTFRIREDKPNQVIGIYCPEGSAGTAISIFVKDDWDKNYPKTAKIKFTVNPENYNTWVNITPTDLGIKYEQEGVVLIKILNGTEELLGPYETGFWNDGGPYEVYKPTDIEIIANDGDYRSENGDDTVLELYIPETTLFYSGTFNVTSNGKTVYSKSVSVRNMEFDDEGRYYRDEIAYGSLNLKGVKSGDILTVRFNSDVKNITKNFFYIIKNNDDPDDWDEWANINTVDFKDANVLRDDVVLAICEFPTDIDDEFVISIDAWSRFINTTWKISELAKNENGIYTFNCTALGADAILGGDSDGGYDFFILFYKDGDIIDEIRGSPYLYKNPFISSDEIDEDEEEGIICMNPKDLQKFFDDDFTINITHNGTVSSLSFKLSEMNKYTYDEEDFLWGCYLTKDDLGINDRGEYNILMEFTENGEKVHYNSTLTVVDFIIEARSNVESITDAVFRILMPKNSTGRAVILVNGTEVFNNTLSYIGYSYWNRMGGYNIPLNYLQINETGNYHVELKVYDDNNTLLRTKTNDLNIIVGENAVIFSDIMYMPMYSETNFLYKSNITKAVPIDARLDLYLNGTKVDSIKVAVGRIEFVNLTKFTNEYNCLMPGLYNAVIKLVDGDSETVFGEGSFNVLTKNGTVSITAPATATSTTTCLSVNLTAPQGNYRYDSGFGLTIIIDPHMDEHGWIDDSDAISMGGGELAEFWYGNTHKIDLGLLTEGVHKILVQYALDDYDHSIDYEFFSDIFTVNVTKTKTVISAPAVTATYNIAKNLVITVKDSSGKILSGKKITVKVGTISKTLKTNSKGQVSVAVSSLVPKKYTATIKFAGDKYYAATSKTAKVTVAKGKTKFVAKTVKAKVKAKTKKVTVTLKDSKGKAVKSKVITMKVSGKTYKVKTNAKGVAVFKVINLKKKGTFTGALKFAGDKYYKAATGKVKIIVK